MDRFPNDTDRFLIHMDAFSIHTDLFPIHMKRFSIHTDQFLIHTDRKTNGCFQFLVRTDQFLIHCDLFAIHADHFLIRMDRFPIHMNRFAILPAIFKSRPINFRSVLRGLRSICRAEANTRKHLSTPTRITRMRRRPQLSTIPPAMAARRLNQLETVKYEFAICRKAYIAFPAPCGLFIYVGCRNHSLYRRSGLDTSDYRLALSMVCDTANKGHYRTVCEYRLYEVRSDF